MINSNRISKRKPGRPRRVRKQHNREYETITEIIKTKNGPQEIMVTRPVRDDDSDSK
jgi:hypothetical protein